ncbi:aprataxin and PNK-like factor isoform X2 [Castor canadensis]|uniref:Aprataxin and PNK-like factor isoform X2 n=1 Tax=Castor canadensis TaxID=51338 RepID=A0A8C0WQH6_CASCN|nr:aprataxin and PNK-like factor isoform X2 [Castor canadensis]
MSGTTKPGVFQTLWEITDKRVSRRHAILEVVGGQLRIKPIHTNPCFYQSSKKSQLLPMKTNVWHWLHPGDSFSLLANKYIFHVFSTHSKMENDCTLRNSQMLDEDNIINETSESSVINLPDKTTGASQPERSTEVTKTQTTTTDSVSFIGECTDFSKQQSNPTQRKRILPAWMLVENLSDKDLSASVISGDKNIIQESGKEGIYKDETPVNVTQQGRKRLISSENSESVSAEQDAGKKYKNFDQEKAAISSKKMPESLSTITLSNTDMNTVTTNTQRNKIEVEEPGKVSEHKVMTKRTPNEEGEAVNCSASCMSVQSKSFPYESQGCRPDSSSDPSSPETLQAKATELVPQDSEENMVKRTSCMYGPNCYRKNPVHFQHFSHPGDRDYGGLEVVGQDETDGRPECPYGASCYRKNPQHKIEYRHSALPVRRVFDEDDGVGQPSECDLNDSFLDEEENEPTDEDSDWEPGKEDEEKEDMEELLKEAKTFMKRKN